MRKQLRTLTVLAATLFSSGALAQDQEPSMNAVVTLDGHFEHFTHTVPVNDVDQCKKSAHLLSYSFRDFVAYQCIDKTGTIVAAGDCRTELRLGERVLICNEYDISKIVASPN